MRVFKQVWALALCFAILAPGAVSAETRLSEKNNPGIVLSAEIDAILTQDHKAIKRSGGFLARLFKGTPKQPDIYYDKAWVDALPVASGDANWKCLTEALYFEARGEDVAGQFAVAEVIMNRVDSSKFPGSVCKVVKQGSGGGLYQCQFSYTCDGLAETISEPEAWEQVGKIARLMLDGAPRLLTHGATFYHNAGVTPGWARKFTRVAEVGPHLFYRVKG